MKEIKEMTIIWLILFIKRLLCRRAFVGFLFLLPLLAIAVRGVGNYTNPSSIELGIVANEGGLAKNAAEYLIKFQGAVRFLPYENEEQMKKDIRQQNIQWGYAFKENMEESILKGQGNRSIICYDTPASFLSKITDELVFASIMRQHGETILMDYVKNNDDFTPMLKQTAKLELPKNYETYRDGSDTFSFEYKSLDGKIQKNSGIVTPIRGICAILILIGGIYGGMMAIENDTMGLYKRLSPRGKALGRLLAVYAPILLLSLSAYLTLLVTGNSFGIFNEFAALLIYSFGVCGFCYIIAMVFFNENTLCGTIPVLSIASLLCCPIFFDVSLFIPGIAIVSKLFLPYYYIQNMLLPMFLIAVICILVGCYLSLKRN